MTPSLFQTVGVIGKRRDPRVTDTLGRLCSLLREHRRDVLVETETARLLPSGSCPTASREELASRCQLIVVIGGDGTLLDAGRSLASSGVPILGVNQGRLGFLVDVRPEDMAATLGALFRGEYIRETRLVLEARVRRADGGLSLPWMAVNDVVIRNQAAIRMVEFATFLASDVGDGWEFISQHRADGFIVSTATGSTAYALSGGGPVVHPALAALALVPICPHTLTDRPIVVPASRTVRIVLGANESGATMTCDGQIGTALSPSDAVEIRRSPQDLVLLHPRHYSYFELLRDKLDWGRNPVGMLKK
ncbi:NAD(+) kinase [Nevskia sp.]|uniref:NAD(+) kinase n=1 Tax=Nevskia sp. TaxID=1929292 RepID=UPI003F6EFEE5